MARKETDDLIRALAQGLKPVRVLRSPKVRASGWLTAVFLILGLFVWFKADLPSFAARFSEPRMGLQCAAILLTGISAVMAAFYLSVPGRSALWRYLPLPFLALWIGTSGLGCFKYGLGLGPAGSRLGLSSHCFVFIVMVSIPLMIFLYVVLRRSRPLEPLVVSVTAALGASALAAFTLQFFHPFDTTWVDLSVHMAAVIAMISVSTRVRAALR